jgi:uncharacterized UBP type Zn finger protein
MQETFTHRHSNGAASIGGGSSSAAMSSSSFKGQSPPLLAGLCTLLTSVLNTPSGSSLGPMDITVLRSHFQAPFSAKQQQDAEEFLTYILDYLETSCGYLQISESRTFMHFASEGMHVLMKILSCN